MRLTKTKIEQLEAKALLYAGKDTFERPIGIYDNTGRLRYVRNARGDFLESEEHSIKMCDVFLDLFNKDLRYVSLRGGRGSGKSVTVAQALLLLGVAERHRILCFREVQSSIRDSVYALLIDLIQQLKLESFYTWTNSEIRGLNGTTFIFRGLSDMTADSIKSMQGITIAWGEEAATLSERSLTTFIPTIREEESRIIFTWNPELDTDEVYQRYVVNPPDDCASIEVNWSDNPWFPEVLEKERAQDQKRWSEAKYNNVWEGKVLPAASGAIYFTEIEATQTDRRITNLHYDPKLKVHVIQDLGWSDSNAIILVQKTITELRIIDYIEVTHMKYEDVNAKLKALPYSNWGTMYLPHDARHGSQATGQTAEEHYNSYGWEVEIVPNMTIQAGIDAARQMFNRVYFDKEKTERLVECLKRYRRQEKSNGAFGAPIHDEYSHGADAFRYLAIVHEKLRNETVSAAWGTRLNYRNSSVFS